MKENLEIEKTGDQSGSPSALKSCKRGNVIKETSKEPPGKQRERKQLTTTTTTTVKCYVTMDLEEIF